MPVVGANCWMVKGTLPGERRFWLCFTGADINAAKTLAVAEAGSEPSLLESFLIDEKKMSLALLVSRGWAEITPTHFRLTRAGLRFADSAAQSFLRPEPSAP